MGVNKIIVLVTVGQPSTNPRIVKEANTLTEAGYIVTVLYCYYIDWAWKADKKILSEAKWKYELIAGSPHDNKTLYFITKTQTKFAGFLNRYIGNRFGIAERVQARGFLQYVKAAKKIKADWYIGHNLGALPVVVKAAAYHNSKAAFDFEDYHRGENDNTIDIDRITYLENKYVPSLQYISTASPLITEKIKSNFPAFKNIIITINNVFPKKDQPSFIKKNSRDNSLQLFWFSQTVGQGRGLEMVLDALKQLNDSNVHLTLVGKYTKETELVFLQRMGAMSSNLYFKGIVNPDEISFISARMDIGLALEQTTPLNRDICLTNKIFTYLLAGNALILTNTKGQTQFQEQYKIGSICNIDDVQSLCNIIAKYKNDIDYLNQQKDKNWHLAGEVLNWENESKKITSIING